MALATLRKVGLSSFLLTCCSCLAKVEASHFLTSSGTASLSSSDKSSEMLSLKISLHEWYEDALQYLTPQCWRWWRLERLQCTRGQTPRCSHWRWGRCEDLWSWRGACKLSYADHHAFSIGFITISLYLWFASLQAKCVSGGGREYLRGPSRISIIFLQRFA